MLKFGIHISATAIDIIYLSTFKWKASKRVNQYIFIFTAVNYVGAHE